MLAGAVLSGHAPWVMPSPPRGLKDSGCPLRKETVLPGWGELQVTQHYPHPRQPSPRDATLSPLPPSNLQLELAVSPVPGTLPILPIPMPLHLHTLPAAGLGEAEQVPWAGRSRLVAVLGRGYQKGGSAMCCHCPQGVTADFLDWSRQFGDSPEGLLSPKAVLVTAPHPAPPRAGSTSCPQLLAGSAAQPWLCSRQPDRAGQW